MAERRMFSRSIVESARFLKMPISSQNLYIHPVMYADDDGVVEAYSVINLVRAEEEDLRTLEDRGFVRILNEDLVTYIVDWKEQNKIRPDRKKDSIYKELLLQVEPDVIFIEKKERSDVSRKSGQSMDGGMSAQGSGAKDIAGERSREECSIVPMDTRIKYRLGTEYITRADYEELIREYPAYVVDDVINRILNKPYHGCLNIKKISAWCAEQKGYIPVVRPKEYGHSELLKRLASKRV